jgi:hypothetical protein
MIIPFRAHGYAGSIDVAYETEGDPQVIGFDLVAVGYDDPERFRGFPVMKASLAYEGTGYRAGFGWVQVINCDDVDVPPNQSDVDSPFAAFGHLPTYYDAPANPDHPDGKWLAETFLVTGPRGFRTKQIMALAGFRWGYELTDGRPTSLRPAAIGADRWNAVRKVLGAQYPGWEFLDWAGGQL